jgi:predicted Fe-S protein YdhL (DUF1289 family)
MDNDVSEPDSWEQQLGEPNRWFARFESFRLAGPSRSLLGSVNADRLVRGCHRSRSVPQAWAKNAKRWQWRERAQVWDHAQRLEARRARARDIDEMNRRHLHEAQALQGKAIQRLKILEPERLSPADVLRFCVESTKLERAVMGEPKTIEEQPLTGNGGGTVTFTLEDAVRADQELEGFRHARMQQSRGTSLPDGSTQMP